MIEKEAKILNINKNDVIQNIKALWGIKTFEGIISWEYYKKDDIKIRVRKEHRWTIVCFKKKIGEDSANVKTMEEIEFAIDNKENFVRVLEELGFSEHKKIYKRRTSFELAWNTIEIDEYAGIPPLLEIEWETDDDILFMAKKLGFNKDDLVSLSFAEIEKSYLKWEKHPQ